MGDPAADGRLDQTMGCITTLTEIHQTYVSAPVTLSCTNTRTDGLKVRWEDADCTEWVEKDTDNFMKPWMEDKMPDPTKFKPLLVTPCLLYTSDAADELDG
eukprot:1842876-Ditylum_brightwellii.AAC.1